MQCLGLLGVRHFTKITPYSKSNKLVECFYVSWREWLKPEQPET